MTEEQIRQESSVDDKKINKLQKKLSHAYYWKRASWRALWPFAYTAYDEPRIVGVAYLIGYAIMLLLFVGLFDSKTAAVIIFAIIYIVKIPLMMYLVNSKIKKLCFELAEYEKKYIAIRDDYIRDTCQRYDIFKTEEGYKHNCNNRFVTFLCSGGDRISVCARLDDFYGNIRIYPVIEADEKESAL